MGSSSQNNMSNILWKSHRRSEAMGEQSILKKYEGKLSKSKEKDEYTNSRGSKNSNKDKSKETYTKTHHNQTVKSHKERILKAAKMNHHVQGSFYYIITSFSTEALQARWKWNDILKVLKENTANQEYHIQQNCPSKMKKLRLS